MEEFAVVSVALRPELCGISLPVGWAYQEVRALKKKKWSQGEGDRSIWISSFRASLQVKQNKIFFTFFLCVKGLTGVTPLLTALWFTEEVSGPYSRGICHQIGTLKFYKWQRMNFQLRWLRCYGRDEGLHPASEVQAPAHLPRLYFPPSSSVNWGWCYSLPGLCAKRDKACDSLKVCKPGA